MNQNAKEIFRECFALFKRHIHWPKLWRRSFNSLSSIVYTDHPCVFLQKKKKTTKPFFRCISWCICSPVSSFPAFPACSPSCFLFNICAFLKLPLLFFQFNVGLFRLSACWTCAHSIRSANRLRSYHPLPPPNIFPQRTCAKIACNWLICLRDVGFIQLKGVLTRVC